MTPEEAQRARQLVTAIESLADRKTGPATYPPIHRVMQEARELVPLLLNEVKTLQDSREALLWVLHTKIDREVIAYDELEAKYHSLDTQITSRDRALDRWRHDETVEGDYVCRKGCGFCGEGVPYERPGD